MPMIAQTAPDHVRGTTYNVPAMDAVQTLDQVQGRFWRVAVAQAATNARQALPDSHGRIDKAVALVCAGAVELLDGGKARVTSQHDGATRYFVVNGPVTARTTRAPHSRGANTGWRALTVKAMQIAKTMGTAEGQVTLTPEALPTLTPAAAPAPTPTISPQFLVEIQGRPFVLYNGLLHMAHQGGLLSLHAEFTQVTDTYALAKATVQLHDGRVFSECGDSTPDNVSAKVKAHWRRMALVRAKARCLRDALDVAYTCAEELE